MDSAMKFTKGALRDVFGIVRSIMDILQLPAGCFL